MAEYRIVFGESPRELMYDTNVNCETKDLFNVVKEKYIEHVTTMRRLRGLPKIEFKPEDVIIERERNHIRMFDGEESYFRAGVLIYHDQQFYTVSS